MLQRTASDLAESLILSRIELSFCHAELGEMNSAIATAEESLRLAKAMDRIDLIAGAHCALGTAYLAKGEFDVAAAMLEECVRVCRLREREVWRARAQSPLGEAHTLAGRVAAGVVRLEQAVKHARFLNHGQAMRLVHLGQAYLWHGRLRDAKDTAHHALSLARQNQETGHEAWALHLLGEIDSCSDPADVEASKASYTRALLQADERGMRPLVARCHLGLGTVHRHTADHVDADRHLTAAASLFRGMGMQSWLLRTELLLKPARTLPAGA